LKERKEEIDIDVNKTKIVGASKGEVRGRINGSVKQR